MEFSQPFYLITFFFLKLTPRSRVGKSGLVHKGVIYAMRAKLSGWKGERGVLSHLNGQVKQRETQADYLDPQVFVNSYQGPPERGGGSQGEREPPKCLV